MQRSDYGPEQQMNRSDASKGKTKKNIGNKEADFDLPKSHADVVVLSRSEYRDTGIASPASHD